MRQAAVLILAALAVLPSCAHAKDAAPCRIELLWVPDRNEIPFGFRDCDNRVVTPEGSLTVRLSIGKYGSPRTVYEETMPVRVSDYKKYNRSEHAFVARCHKAMCGDGSYFPTLLSAKLNTDGATISLDRSPILVQVGDSQFAEPTENDVSEGSFLALSAAETEVKAGSPVRVRLRAIAPGGGVQTWKLPDTARPFREFFAFSVADDTGRKLPTVYPQGVFEPLPRGPGRLYDERGITERPPLGKPRDELLFELLGGGGVPGWSGRIPGLAKPGRYRIQVISGNCIFCRASDGINGRSFSNELWITVR